MQNFEPVTKPVGAGNGIIKIIKAGKLKTYANGEKSEETLEAGTAVVGVLEAVEDNKYSTPEAPKSDYKLRGEDGTLFVLPETASLKRQMNNVAIGELLQITYNGKKTITRKNGSSAPMHDFAVARAVNAE